MKPKNTAARIHSETKIEGRTCRCGNRQARNRDARLERAAHLTSAKLVPASEARALLEAVLEPGDRVCLEGNNQKQADFLAKSLAAVSPERVHDLHMV